MSPTPEPADRAAAFASREGLLVRTKVRSLAIRRHRMFGAGVSSMAVLALVLSLVLLPSGSASPQQANSTPAKIFISDRIGNAYELSADEPGPHRHRPQWPKQSSRPRSASPSSC